MFATEKHAFTHDGIVLAKRLQSTFFDVGQVRKTGIVDQHVQLAELFLDASDDLLPLLLVTDILVHECRVSACRPNRLGGRFAVCLVDIGQHDLGAFAGENLCIGLAKPGRRSRDQCHFAVDSAHTPSPSVTSILTIGHQSNQSGCPVTITFDFF